MWPLACWNLGLNPVGGMDVCVVSKERDQMQGDQDKETSADEVKTEYKKLTNSMEQSPS